MADNLIKDLSFAFALEVIGTYKFLVNEHKEFVMSKQLLRCGTSIGANIKEALRAQSHADFGAKMNISLKEASEAEYWIELLYQSDYLSTHQSDKLLSQCHRIIRVLTAIVKTTFKNK